MSAAASIEGGRALARPFATAAPDLAERWGLPVLPLEGQRPMFQRWDRMVCGIEQGNGGAAKYPAANVGRNTGHR